ncbi:type II toxin-antitoxin system Phd/YefM family antitoxin [Abiotrophia sp. HMSC24B09]|uniref:type II toxin-antitoxin system Phd/YefM family antitoxin n=1 Tax=Abiotrophia sp. HMSC24B09 TaxID=1581061 RepID=UPI0008A4B7B8|nr:type II toxin-antitoxin system Phd/YefM family antitoxin [Abiotrophia sp. HMSC24B09]OFS28930.1 prevent-host-death protein [Abiotrophia sp. HMSC24B09]
MINIRPVSDLRNKYPEIEAIVQESQAPVYLTKNGYGSMVVMSIEHYASLTESVESALDMADQMAAQTDTRLEHDQVFSDIRKRIDGK